MSEKPTALSERRCHVFTSQYKHGNVKYDGLYVRINGRDFDKEDQCHVLILPSNETRARIVENVPSPSGIPKFDHGYVPPSEVQRYLDACREFEVSFHADLKLRFIMWRGNLLPGLAERSPTLFVMVECLVELMRLDAAEGYQG